MNKDIHAPFIGISLRSNKPQVVSLATYVYVVMLHIFASMLLCDIIIYHLYIINISLTSFILTIYVE